MQRQNGMKWKDIQLTLRSLLHQSLKTSHSRIVSCGLLVGLVYSLPWLYGTLSRTLFGASSSLLSLTAAALGAFMIWQQRQQLSTLTASPEDRWLGHLMVIVGVGLAPFCFATEWSQQLVWMLTLAGIAISSWGIQFFKLYFSSVFLVFVGLFPRPAVVAEVIWQTFIPANALNQFAAWGGGLGLRAIGQSATVRDTIVTLPGGSVEVLWACNGFAMALALAAASLILGIFFKQKPLRILLMSIMAFGLALIGNFPRITLMAMANAYWGKAAFDFWHGAWGGQIFASILATIYYYAAMAIVKRPQPKRVALDK